MEVAVAVAVAGEGGSLMRTFRRLNDGARYYGLTWQGWQSIFFQAVCSVKKFPFLFPSCW